MGHKYKNWQARSARNPQAIGDITEIIQGNRSFTTVPKLDYGDAGLDRAFNAISEAIKQKKMIALYADYDVDGTMSCVSWLWFLKAINYPHVTYYIPDRFKEGYGVNLDALKYLVKEKGADLIITMDTGITANTEAAWCKSQGVEFICTDHHKIQKDRMPDCIILNPKMHPNPLYQELCGCGITFVLLRKLGQLFPIPDAVWTDILALAGMATICDVVPLNGVNHKLAQMGVAALARSKREVIQKLFKACTIQLDQMDEQDVGFKLGPRINAVGRLEHAHLIIEAFAQENPDQLIAHMDKCNEKRKAIQADIVAEARELAKQYQDQPILFLGGDWHQGVVGIAASKIAEEFWKPTWLFNNQGAIFKGSARSIPNFDVTDAMSVAASHFLKFGGHKAAGGFSFAASEADTIRNLLCEFAGGIRAKDPQIWESLIYYDCHLDTDHLDLSLLDHLEKLRPFGHGFEEPIFRLGSKIEEVRYYPDKKTNLPKHTAVFVRSKGTRPEKIMFFNEVLSDLADLDSANFLVSMSRNTWMGKCSLSLIGRDYSISL